MAILAIQKEYVETGSPDLLGKLYKELTMLGFKIINGEKYAGKVFDEDVRDIASSVVLRLMETKKPIITCAPSSYIRRALFYKFKEWQRVTPTIDYADIKYTTVDVMECDIEALIGEIMGSLEIPSSLQQTALDVMRCNISLDEARKKLPHADAKRLVEVMEDVRRYVS